MSMGIEDLIDRLVGDPAPPPSSAIARLSGLDAAGAEVLRRSWGRIPVDRRRRLVRAMAELAEDSVDLDFCEVFRIALDDPDAEVRLAAVDGSWEDESLGRLRVLLAKLQSDPAPAVRAGVAAALGRFAYLAEVERLPAKYRSRIYDGLMAAIQDPTTDREVRRRAVEAVAYFSGSDEVERTIVDLHQEPEATLQASALFAMGRTADSRWLPTLAAAMTSTDPAQRYEAARSAGEIGDAAITPRLAALIEDDDQQVRQAAIWALGQVGGPRAERLLLACRQSADQATREAASEALAELRVNTDPLQVDFDLHTFE